MKIQKLYIKNFKNLKDVSIDFGESSKFNVLIGKNGSGKSNLFEAIIEIFLFLLENNGEEIFEFDIDYLHKDEKIRIKYQDETLYFNESSVKKIDKKYLPETIFLYYSGHNKRMMEYVEKYEAIYRGKNRRSLLKKNKILRNIFGIFPSHKEILLLLTLLLDSPSSFKKETLDNLGLDDYFTEGKLILKRPFYAKNKKMESMSIYDEQAFWGIYGDLKNFLQQLDKGNEGNVIAGNEGFYSQEQKYYITLNEKIIREFSKNNSLQVLFSYFDDLRVADMIDSFDFKIKKSDGEIIKVSNLSEGKVQTLIISTILEIFSDKEYLFLMDEPDAFLHPEWQIKLLKSLKSRENFKSHLIFSTHNASTVSMLKEEILFFRKDNDSLKVHNVKMPFALKQLSSNLIKLDEKDGILSICDSVAIEDKPIILTEGISDVIILETAWNKLRTEEIPFKIIPTFNDEFLQRLVLDEKFQNNCKENPIFALFDFDEAYNCWKRLIKQGTITQPNPYEGLTTKIKDKNIYALLLPVPNEEAIRRQVIKNEDSLKTFEGESRMSIELLFFNKIGTEDYFIEEPCVGGKKIIFKNSKHKIKFAEHTKALPKEAFSNFEKLFENIEKLINSSSEE